MSSILTDTKKILGLGDVTDEFDLDILIHINSVFSTLNQLGIGPVTGFAIEDATAEWEDFLAGDSRLNQIKTYIYLRVRLLFDPPATSFHLVAMEKQIEQIEWRLNVMREDESWIAPTPPVPTDPEVIIIPSNQAWYSEP
jgi:hypothetical protein